MLDLARIQDFLVSLNPAAALKVVQTLQAAALTLLDRPRIGSPLERYQPREVRRLIVAKCEIRYEIVETAIIIVRIWHTREDR